MKQGEKNESLAFQAGIIDRMMHLCKCATDAELGRYLDIRKGTLSNYRNGRRKIPVTLLMRLSAENGANLDWLVNAKSASPAPVIRIQENAKLKNFHPDYTYDSYIPVRLLKDEIAAGSPAEIREQDIDGYCLMPADRTWMPGNAEMCTCCRVRGNSMYPILTDGDIVAIDHSLKNPQELDGKMAAFRQDGGATVKWLSMLQKNLVLGIPENREETAHTVCLKGEEIENGIIGRVVWWWARR